MEELFRCLAEQVNNAREQDAAALLVPAEGVGNGQTEAGCVKLGVQPVSQVLAWSGAVLCGDD